ncbi:MAG: hypothetical protein H7267_12570 [Sandarakinorhabdus sp.]|nr:hypothetical protein [Sandarakinorhabdus sp.]
MDMTATGWLLGIGALLSIAALAGDWARRRAPLAWHAHLPWNAMVFAGLVTILFGIVHLLGLTKAG